MIDRPRHGVAGGRRGARDHTLTRWTALAPLCVALACGCGGRDAGAPDAASADGGVDAAPARDAGADADPGPGDAAIDGGAIDSGPEEDAFVPLDAGMPLDLLRDGWCTPRAYVACRDRWTCGCGGERPPPELESCVSFDVGRCLTELEGRLGPYLADGRVRADASALDACARRMAASFAACSARRDDLLELCLGVLVTDAALGEVCVARDAVCAGGAGTCITGLCERLPLAGEDCAHLGQCAPGLACREGSCAALATLGEACARDGHCAGELLCVDGACAESRAAIGAPCADTAECVAGARCDGAICTPSDVRSCASDADCASLSSCVPRLGRVCQDPAPLGAPCTSDAACGALAYCDPSTSTCEALRGAGEPCPFGDRQCALDATCDIAVAPPLCRGVGGPGDPCAVTMLPARDGCRSDLACVRGTCAIPPALGEACADDEECAIGLACRVDPSLSELRCATPGATGEPCTSVGWRNECIDGLFCDTTTGSGVCTPQHGLDEPCDGDSYECHTGLTCLRLPDGTGTCSAIPSRGGECADLCADRLVCAEGTLEAICTPWVCDALPTSGR